MISDPKKMEWLQKTGNPAALELLSKSIEKNAELSTGLLYKEQEEPKEMNTEVKTDEVQEVVVTETEVQVVEPVVETPVLQKAEDVIDMLEPLITAMQQLTDRMEKLEKSVANSSKVTAQLLPTASAKSLLKERLQFIGPANTMLIDADATLLKSKPAENTVKTETESANLFSDFLNGQ